MAAKTLDGFAECDVLMRMDATLGASIKRAKATSCQLKHWALIGLSIDPKRPVSKFVGKGHLAQPSPKKGWSATLLVARLSLMLNWHIEMDSYGEYRIMARRKGFSSFVTAVARESARTNRQLERAAKAAVKQQIRQARELDREEKRAYLESQEEEAASLNAEVAEQIAELSSLIEHTLAVNDAIAFESLKQSEYFAEFVAPSFNEAKPSEPTGVMKFWPGAKSGYEAKLRAWQERRDKHFSNQESFRNEYEKKRNAFLGKARERNLEIDEFKNAYYALDSEAIISYNMMVLERSEYPADFPQIFRIAYVPESKELVVEYELPMADVIPAEEQFRYVKSKDEIVSKPKKAKEIKELYQDIVAGLAIRTIHEVFEADQANALAAVSFSGYVNSRDPGTGKKIKPFLVSVRATKEKFLEIDLKHINKAVCLRNLGAHVSAKPDEMQAVKPIIEFDMVDKRFVEQSDLLSELEARANLMDLTPSAFETLVSNLFQQLGLEAKLTRTSRDGGVDCVAFDNRPVLGGKVVIQAKRYKHTVGVSAVRDLYGTMQHEGANKGILVSTSGYGPDAFEFAKDKPIELIGGGQLLYLLEQVGIQARIVFPVETSP